MTDILLKNPEPYIRYVNNYRPAYSYVEKERILYDHEFMYVMNGEVEMHYDGNVYLLKKGDLFYLKPMVKNYIVVEESKHFRTHCIHFDWHVPQPEYDFSVEEHYMYSVLSPDHYERARKLRTRPQYAPADLLLPNHICNASFEKLSPLFAKCYYAFLDKSQVSRFQLKAAFWEILAELSCCISGSRNSQPVHPKILYAMEYIRANYTQNITVAQLAEKYGLSPKYFGTLFKKASGKTVGDFVLGLRIYAAKEMLLGTDMTIEEISEKIGFQNSFYFSRCFKMQEKVSPSGYRNLMEHLTNQKI